MFSSSSVVYSPWSIDLIKSEDRRPKTEDLGSGACCNVKCSSVGHFDTLIRRRKGCASLENCWNGLPNTKQSNKKHRKIVLWLCKQVCWKGKFHRISRDEGAETPIGTKKPNKNHHPPERWEPFDEVGVEAIGSNREQATAAKRRAIIP